MAGAGGRARARAAVGTAGAPGPAGRVALVLTVLNEAATVDALLASVAAQRRPPDEVVVVDGGSTDGTRARLLAWRDRLPLRVLDAPGANISRGRNLAVAASTADVLAVTDAGVRLDPDWLAHLLGALRPEVGVVAGFFRPDPRSAFERALGATVLPAREDVRPDRFLPSSRSLLVRRAAWAQVGGYPEWLDYCEDLVFDLALKRAGVGFAFAPEAVAWFRPRPSLRAFFRQYYLYARGDGKADLWRRRHAARYAAYLCLAWLLRGLPAHPGRNLALLALGVAAYTRRPYARLRGALRGLTPAEAGAAIIVVPIIRLTGDLAKMLGYPVGVAWRARARRATRWTSRSSF